MLFPILPSIKTYEEFEELKLQENLWERATTEILNRHGLPQVAYTHFPEGSNVVLTDGSKRVIKIYPPVLAGQFESERLVLEHLKNRLSVNTPILEHWGEIDHWPYVVMSRLEGKSLENLWEEIPFENQVTLIRRIGKLIREVHDLPTLGLEAIDSHWKKFTENQIQGCASRHGRFKLPENLLSEIPLYLESTKGLIPENYKPVLLTGEYTPMNILVKQNDGTWEVDGLIDFGDCMLGMYEYDLMGPGAFLAQGNKVLSKELLLAYGYVPETLNQELSQRLTALTLLHRYSQLDIQIRIDRWKEKSHSLKDLENLIWGF